MIRPITALIEVCLVLSLVHVAFRSFRHFTAWGSAEARASLNFSMGLLMALATLALLFARRRGPRDWGLTTRGWRESVSLALFVLLVLCVLGAVIFALRLPSRPAGIDVSTGAIYAFLGLGVTCGVFWIVKNRPGVGVAVPATLGLAIVGCLLLTPVLLCALRHGDTAAVSLAVIWRFAFAGFGEEAFFRGYIQGRLNDTFGRPWRFLGVRFGVGLLAATLLFALVHLLNPFDYFRGDYSFAWGHALATIGFTYGFLREKTGTILAPALVHGLINVLVLIPRVLSMA